jgi:hypothetical protein
VTVAKRRGSWTQAEVDEFDRWHAQLIVERGYPEEIVRELRRACQKWLSQIRVVG